MKAVTPGLFKASAIAIALLGSTAVVVSVAAPDIAFAKDGNGNGGGKGGGKGGGNNNGGNGKGGGHGASKPGGENSIGKFGNKSSKSKTTAAKRTGRKDTERNSAGVKGFSLKGLFGGKKARSYSTKTTPKSVKVKRHLDESVRPEIRPKGNKMAALLGVHPSELGALNAANASETALNNASPNSRVGRIATYRETVLAGNDLRDALEEKEALLDGMMPPDRPVSDIEDELEVTLMDIQEKQELVTELEEALADAGGDDPDLQEQLDQANSELQDSVAEAEKLAAEREAAIEYDETAAEVEELADLVSDQAATEREALENAANKPVTDEVEAAVKALLGL
ncbi:MAG: hypothetical protein ACWA49_12980 [Ruegeria sp.]